MDDELRQDPVQLLISVPVDRPTDGPNGKIKKGIHWIRYIESNWNKNQQITIITIMIASTNKICSSYPISNKQADINSRDKI